MKKVNVEELAGFLESEIGELVSCDSETTHVYCRKLAEKIGNFLTKEPNNED